MYQPINEAWKKSQVYVNKAERKQLYDNKYYTKPYLQKNNCLRGSTTVIFTGAVFSCNVVYILD